MSQVVVSHSDQKRPPLLKDASHFLSPHSSEWRNVAVGLDVSYNYIKSLEQQGQMIDNKMIDILNKWLQSHCSEPSWDNLLKVLSNKGLNSVAEEIVTWLSEDPYAIEEYDWKPHPVLKPLSDPKLVPKVQLLVTKAASCDESFTCELLCTDVGGSPVFVSDSIACTVTPPTNNEVIECQVTKSSQTGRYEVQFTPLVAGTHTLQVKLNGEAIFEDSIPVKIRQIPRIITDFNRPWMPGLIDNETLVITECVGHCITIYGYTCNTGRRSCGSRGSGLMEFVYPSGLAVTSSGTLIVSDGANHRIKELSSTGSCLNRVGKKGSGQLRFNQPKGITIHEKTGNIYVTEYANHRIQVLDSNLTYHRTIGGKGSKPGLFKNPYNTAFDSEGYLYVTDYRNHRIQKLTPDGRLILHFGTKGSGEGELRNPVGITVDSDDTVYVTERYNHRVSMFTTL